MQLLTDLQLLFADWDRNKLSLDEALNDFYHILDNVLDKHALKTSAKVSVKKKNTWYTPELKYQKRVTRRCERI